MYLSLSNGFGAEIDITSCIKLNKQQVEVVYRVLVKIWSTFNDAHNNFAYMWQNLDVFKQKMQLQNNFNIIIMINRM